MYKSSTIGPQQQQQQPATPPSFQGTGSKGNTTTGSSMHVQRLNSTVSPTFSLQTKKTSNSRAEDSLASSQTSHSRQSYRTDYSRAQHVAETNKALPTPPTPTSREPPSPSASPTMTPEQQRFSAFMNRFAAHDPRVSPIRRNPNHHQPPLPNFHAISVTERIKRFSDRQGEYSPPMEYTEQNQSTDKDPDAHYTPTEEHHGSPSFSRTREIAQRFEQTPSPRITPTSSSSSTEHRQPRTERPSSMPPVSRARSRAVKPLATSDPRRRLEPPASNEPRDTQASESAIVRCETPTVNELKRQLWDASEKLQVAVPPSLQYDGHRTSRSLSPNRPQYSKQPVFKSKFYEAAVAARKANTRPVAKTADRAVHQPLQKQKQHDDQEHPKAQEMAQQQRLAQYVIKAQKQQQEQIQKQAKQLQQQAQQQKEQQKHPPRPNMWRQPPPSPSLRQEVPTRHEWLEEASPHEALPQETPPHEASPQETPPQQASPQEALPQEAPRQYHAPDVDLEQTDSGTMSSRSVSMLVARLNAISRSDPAKALAQIDSILKNESRSTASDPDLPINTMEDEESDDDSSDDETSVSEITDPTYQSVNYRPDDIATLRKPARPNALMAYTKLPSQMPSIEQVKTEQKKKDKEDRRTPPPATIKVNANKDAESREDYYNKLEGHLNKSTLDPHSPAAIALKIRMWDELSQSKPEGEDCATAVTEELGSIMTPADAAAGTPYSPRSTTPTLGMSRGVSPIRSPVDNLARRRKHPWDKHHPKHRRPFLTMLDTSMEDGSGIELKANSPNWPRKSQPLPDHSDVAAGVWRTEIPLSNDPPAPLERNASHRVSDMVHKQEVDSYNIYPQPAPVLGVSPSSTPHSKPGYSGDSFEVDPKLFATELSIGTKDTAPDSNSDLDAAAWVNLPPNAFFAETRRKSFRSVLTETMPQEQLQQQRQLTPRELFHQRQPNQQTSRRNVTLSRPMDPPASMERPGSTKSEPAVEAKSPSRRFRLSSTLLKRKNTPTRLAVSSSMDDAEVVSPKARRSFSSSPGRRLAKSDSGDSATRNSNFAQKLTRLMRIYDHDKD